MIGFISACLMEYFPFALFDILFRKILNGCLLVFFPYSSRNHWRHTSWNAYDSLPAHRYQQRFFFFKFMCFLPSKSSKEFIRSHPWHYFRYFGNLWCFIFAKFYFPIEEVPFNWSFKSFLEFIQDLLKKKIVTFELCRQ